jgi:putative transposase
MGLVARDDGWRMPDWLWGRIALPSAPPRPFGCHRPRVPDRDAMEALVLRWGCIGTRSTRPGSVPSSSAHRRFQEWEQAGVFAEIWRQGLLDYDQFVGIDWAWLAADGAMTKAPLGGAKTGLNPTDRAKRGGRNVRFSARRQGCRSSWHTTAPTVMTRGS